MRPARMLSRWVKIVPWYYTEKTAPSREADEQQAIQQDLEDSGESEE